MTKHVFKLHVLSTETAFKIINGSFYDVLNNYFPCNDNFTENVGINTKKEEF